MIPKGIQKFIEVFSALPSFGPRQATRLAFYLVGLGAASLADVLQAVQGLRGLRLCPDCFFVTDSPSCPFCSDARRDTQILAVVERPTDVLALEKTRAFNGVYLVLGDMGKTGSLAPDQKLKLAHARLRGPFKEILLAFDQTTYGDFNASLVMKELEGLAPTITRLGRGIPTGGEIEFADEETLGGALRNRG